METRRLRELPGRVRADFHAKKDRWQDSHGDVYIPSFGRMVGLSTGAVTAGVVFHSEYAR